MKYERMRERAVIQKGDVCLHPSCYLSIATKSGDLEYRTHDSRLLVFDTTYKVGSEYMPQEQSYLVRKQKCRK